MHVGAPRLEVRLAGGSAARGSIVTAMSFWDRQIEELTAGIAALLDDDRTARNVREGYPAPVAPPIAPGTSTTAGSDETVTLASRTVPVEWTGRGADAVGELQESIQRVQSARTEADRKLGDAVMAVDAAAQHAHERLQRTRAEIATGTGALRSTMDTTTGRRQMAEFLAAKTRDLRTVIDEARETSATHTAAIGEALARYDSIRG